MLLKVGKLLVKSYLLLLVVAAGGLAGATLSGFVPAIMEFASDSQRAPKPETFMPWLHGGWLVGVGFALVGVVQQKLWSMKRSSDEPAENQSASGKDATKQITTRWWNSDHQEAHSKHSGILSSVGFGSLVGGILGLLMGASFALLWFSLAFSPFAPDGWASSVSLKKMRTDTHEESLMTTDHPMAVYAFGVPIALGVTAGGLIFGVGAGMGNVLDIE